MAGKAVVINSSTGTGASVSFTSSGFGTPTGAIIFFSLSTASNSDTAGAGYTVAIWDGTNTKSVCHVSKDNAASSDSYNYTNSTSITLLTQAGSVDAVGTIATTTDGITVSFSNTPDSDWKCTVVLFGGSGLNIHAGHARFESNGAGSTTYASASFEAQAGIFFFGNWTALDTVNAQSIFNAGIAVNDASLTQYGFGFRDIDNANTMDYISNAGNYACVGVSSQAAQDFLFSLTEWTSTGFTLINNETNGSDPFIIFLLLGGLNDFSLDSTPMPSGTGVTSFTGPGFEPELIFCVQSGLPSAARSTTQDINMTLGVSDGTSTGGIAVYGDDGAGTSNTANRHNTTLGTSDQTTAAEQWNYTLDSFDADGYNFNYTEVGTSGDIGFTLAIQFESAVTPITGYWAMDGVFEL